MELSEAVKKDLEKQHRTERDQRIADRIKAVLLNTEGWSNKLPKPFVSLQKQ